MNWNELGISWLAVLWVVVVAFVVFTMLQLIRLSIKKISMRRSYQVNIFRVLPLFETVVWFLFLVWGVHFVFGKSFYFPPLVILVLFAAFIWVWWFALRDFIAGIILKTQDLYEDDQRIRIAETSGKIRKMGHLGLEIESSDGEIVKVPYNKITGRLLWKNKPQERENHYQFRLEVPKSNDIRDWISRVQTVLLNMPWISPQKEPEVRMVGETPECFVLDVRVYSPGTEYFHLIEKETKEYLGLDEQVRKSH